MSASSTVVSNPTGSNGNGGVKKLDSTGETFKKVSAFIHWKREKFRKEAERIFNEQMAERQRKEEALRKQQLENEQCIQNLNEEISKLQQKKLQLERTCAKDFEDLNRKLNPDSRSRQESQHHMRNHDTHISRHHHSNHRSNRSPVTSGHAPHAHSHSSRSGGGSSRGYQQMHHPHHQHNPHHPHQLQAISSSGAPKGLSPPASQLNNTVHHHSRQQLHHDVTSSRKRNRSRSPSPQLVKMYSAGAPRPVTPRGSALSPVAHGVNSICLPPGTNNSPHASRTLFDQALAASGYVNTTLANLHATSAAAAAHSARYGASATLPPQVSVEQLTSSAASPYHHHVSSAAVNQQHQAAAAAYQQHAARQQQNLSHYAIGGRDHQGLHPGANQGLSLSSAAAAAAAAHSQMKSRWQGHGGFS